MNKIERYENRKKKRLVKRMWNADSADEAERLGVAIYNNFAGARRLDADDDIDWITINGTHTPLQNGTAIGGGKLTGRDFSQAKSVKSGKPKLDMHAPKEPDWPETHAGLEQYYKDHDKWEEDIQKIAKASIPEHSTTKEEMQAWAENKGITVSDAVYDNVDGRMLTLFTDRYDQLSEDFPEAENIHCVWGEEEQDYGMRISFGEVGDDKQNAVMYASGDGIGFGNPCKDIESLAEHYTKDKACGWCVNTAQGLNSLIDHEYGHRIYMAILGSVPEHEVGNVQDVFIDSAYNKAGMSEYGSSNDSELFAESFAAYYGGEKTEFANASKKLIDNWRSGNLY